MAICVTDRQAIGHFWPEPDRSVTYMARSSPICHADGVDAGAATGAEAGAGVSLRPKLARYPRPLVSSASSHILVKAQVGESYQWAERVIWVRLMC